MQGFTLGWWELHLWLSQHRKIAAKGEHRGQFYHQKDDYSSYENGCIMSFVALEELFYKI